MVFPINIQKSRDFYSIQFNAMASPCELLVCSQDLPIVNEISKMAYGEVERIEQKFSRYLKGNLCYRINNAGGDSVVIDDECYRLLEFSGQCHIASEGLFDITSGVLRRLWVFDGGNKIPQQIQIDRALNKIGWSKVSYSQSYIKMPAGMEIDFGGIGKEYAVASVVQKCIEIASGISIVVNFGGDIQITCPRKDHRPWYIGIEIPNKNNKAGRILKINSGALATSGDSRRFILKNGVRYGHVLNPKTGWPVVGAPRSVTVFGQECVQAGSLATMALLQGDYAEDFLKAQNVQYWCAR